jgi:hypothetical protein
VKIKDERRVEAVTKEKDRKKNEERREWNESVDKKNH